MKKSKVLIRNGKNGATVLIGKHNLQESIHYIQAHQITNIEITYRYDKVQIDFLSECPGIENIILEGQSVENFEGAYHLKGLRTLIINDASLALKIDLSQLTSLEEIFGKLPPKTLAIESLINLKKMMIWGYESKEQNLKEFAGFKNLVHLELINSNIISLEGIQELKMLNFLGLSRMKGLTDIEAIQHLTENLTKLQIHLVKNIQDFSPIEKLRMLEYLSLNSCGDIPSIRFTKHLHNLKTLIFEDSNVVDGDVSPCVGLEHVYFTDNKHYSHGLKEVISTPDGSSLIESIVEKKTKPDLKNKDGKEHLMLTQKWIMRMGDGDDQFTEENIAETEIVLQSYADEVSRLEEPFDENIFEKVKQTVLYLNTLNEKHDFFIETLEREELVTFIIEKAKQAGLDIKEDITERWREW
ncbi:hypothetical protein [Planococcus alpniumensis]|uniref:hypothetical protein n=1 Tax=Planococcus alpniumensis TaxID=2708345 RepID=UPI0020116308|nr:hypothetical protein [Planococcus sp. MSAK28401]